MDFLETVRPVLSAASSLGVSSATMALAELDKQQAERVVKLQLQAMQIDNTKTPSASRSTSTKSVKQDNKITINVTTNDVQKFATDLNKQLGGFGDDALRILVGGS
jgi:hypothetical protein